MILCYLDIQYIDIPELTWFNTTNKIPIKNMHVQLKLLLDINLVI